MDHGLNDAILIEVGLQGAFLDLNLLSLAVPVPLVDFALAEAEALGKFSKHATLGPVSLLLELTLQDEELVAGQSLTTLSREGVI